MTRQNWGRVSCGQEVSRAGRSSLSARSARLTSCPCRWPQRSAACVCKRVGKCGDRVLVVRRGGSTAKATRPQGELTLARQKEPTGDSSQTLLPGSARKTSADAQEKPACRQDNQAQAPGELAHGLSAAVVARRRVTVEDMLLRSAWIKWARGVEHQKAFAREMREFDLDNSYEYVQWDNLRNLGDDPLVRMYWRLKIKKQYPERWSILLGDVLTDFRAALDHAMYDAVLAHSGQPERPESIEFPIYRENSKSYRDKKRKLSLLVAPIVWELVEAVQPFHGEDIAHTSPLEILRALSNVDKHRKVHVIGRTAVDMAPVHMQSETPIDIVHEWRHEGEVQDGTVMGRLKFRRPELPQRLDVLRTFAHEASIQISDDPVEFRPLASLMEVIRGDVMDIVATMSGLLNAPFPEELELGDVHDTYALERSGNLLFFTSHEGVRQQLLWPGTSEE